jgi:hypothetical protein
MMRTTGAVTMIQRVKDKFAIAGEGDGEFPLDARDRIADVVAHVRKVIDNDPSSYIFPRRGAGKRRRFRPPKPSFSGSSQNHWRGIPEAAPAPYWWWARPTRVTIPACVITFTASPYMMSEKDLKTVHGPMNAFCGRLAKWFSSNIRLLTIGGKNQASDVQRLETSAGAFGRT